MLATWYIVDIKSSAKCWILERFLSLTTTCGKAPKAKQLEESWGVPLQELGLSPAEGDKWPPFLGAEGSLGVAMDPTWCRFSHFATAAPTRAGQSRMALLARPAGSHSLNLPIPFYPLKNAMSPGARSRIVFGRILLQAVPWWENHSLRSSSCRNTYAHL